VKHSNLQAITSGKGNRTGDQYSLYISDHLRANIYPPRCQQYKPGHFLSVRLLNWDEIMDKGDDGRNGADPEAPSGARSRPNNDNDNDHGKGEGDSHGGDTGTGKYKGTQYGKG
jgi:hypothetical protein